MKQHKEIQLENETHYLTKDLKKFFAEIFKAYKKKHFNVIAKNVNVKCVYSRKNVVNVEASGHITNIVTMKFPKQIHLYNRSTKLRNVNHNIGILDDENENENNDFGQDSFEEKIARMFIFALDYNLRKIQNKLENIDISIMPNIPIREKKPIVKEKKTDSIKINALQKLKANWERKLRRAENAISKLDKKIKYYENKKK